jgi:hypothetical protein
MKSILEHTQYQNKKKKRLSLRLQMYDLDINCSDSIKGIILVCIGGGGSPGCCVIPQSVQPQCCHRTWNFIIRDDSFVFHLLTSFPIYSLHSFIHRKKNLFSTHYQVSDTVLASEKMEIIDSPVIDACCTDGEMGMYTQSQYKRGFISNKYVAIRTE